MNECYKCKHRGSVAGSCHSSCHHPDIEDSKRFLHLLVVMGVGATAVGGKDGWLIKGDPHGVQKGWFQWPDNFDPVWIVGCGGYEAKTDTE